MQNDKAAALPPEWAWDRAYELARGVNHNVAFARYIAEHETAPVDPLLIEALKELNAAATPGPWEVCDGN